MAKPFFPKVIAGRQVGKSRYGPETRQKPRKLGRRRGAEPDASRDSIVARICEYLQLYGAVQNGVLGSLGKKRIFGEKRKK